ncbi:hypothetical protein [Parendozoicomonas haliclonae]|uniref:hypothetical protein n=1 Tax=Parendozoicomonas haliclonae TaxID=1960125 RepID=UPI001055189D|nr:hypothetical protein [Parendozoicomonas haliclonae]
MAETNPDKVLSQVQQEMDSFYNDHYRPNNKEIIASIGNGAILDAARENAGNQYAKTLEQNERNLARYGMSRTAFDTEMAKHSAAVGASNASLGEVNQARIQQYERDNQIRQQMINQGRDMTGQAISGLSSASNNYASVENANAQSAAAAEAQQNQMMAQGVATAAMMVMMM